MKKIIAFCFILFLALASNAQGYTTTVTEFNKFIIDDDIQWAQYDNDTIRFLTPDVRELLINRIKKNDINGYLSMRSGSEDELHINPQSPDQIERALPAVMQKANLISGEIDSSKYRDPEADSLAKGLLNVYRILYVKNNRLYSQVSRVAPLITVITTSGRYLGNLEYFTTAIIGDIKKSNPRKRDKTLFLKSTERIFDLDSTNNKVRLKETFGRNMLQNLWPGIQEGKLKTVDMEGNALSYEHLNNGMVQKINVPVYDSTGTPMGKELVNMEIRPDMFKRVMIKEDWYYNVSRNIFYSLIKELTVSANDFSDYNETALKPVFKIIF